MRLGVRLGPVWVSTGASRHRRSDGSFVPALVGFSVIIALLDMIASGGWWVVLGYTLIGLFVLGFTVRAVKHTPGAQHQGGGKTLAANPEPVSERMYHSDRR